MRKINFFLLSSELNENKLYDLLNFFEYSFRTKTLNIFINKLFYFDMFNRYV